MDAIGTLGAVLGLSYVSGMRLYTAALAIGAGLRLELLELPPGLEALEIFASGPVLIVAAILYTVEFVADKIPWFDSLWDAVHTFIRPLGSAVIAATAVGSFDESIRVGAAMLLGGGVGLTSHLTKAETRVVVNQSPEPFSNAAVSVGEDGLVAAGVWLALTHPVIAFVVFAVITVLSILISLWLYRFLRRRAKDLSGFARRLFERGKKEAAPTT